MTDRFTAAKQTLERADQAHVLDYYDQLEEAGREQLLSQIESIDWQAMSRLVDTHVLNKPPVDVTGELAPAPCYPNRPDDALLDKYAKAAATGEQLLRAGKVAAFTVAGGQGTRLGFDGPKGAFAATPIRKLPLFACFADYIVKAQQKYGTQVPWYIMTSTGNDADTRAFFDEHNHFGIDRQNIMFFPQEMMPAFCTQTGKVLLDTKAALALSPNGHGGSLKALYTSGAIDDMKRRGIEQISYVQVDNPIVRVVDPLFIGLHALDRAAMSSKMVPKVHAKEKLGNFCLIDGRIGVIEYSDLPDELAVQQLDNGELRFRAGSIAIHVIRVDFVESLNQAAGGFALPFHRAQKKVPCLDPQTGERIEPDEPNAVKLEMFVFDALPLCASDSYTPGSIIYETERIEEFAPIKNTDADPLEDSVDSPYTSRQIQIERAARWLEQQGVKLPRDAAGCVDAVIEIAASTAIAPDDLAAAELPASIAAGQSILL